VLRPIQHGRIFLYIRWAVLSITFFPVWIFEIVKARFQEPLGIAARCLQEDLGRGKNCVQGVTGGSKKVTYPLCERKGGTWRMPGKAQKERNDQRRTWRPIRIRGMRMTKSADRTNPEELRT
jgi:hypothetical protein